MALIQRLRHAATRPGAVTIGDACAQVCDPAGRAASVREQAQRIAPRTTIRF